MNVSRYERREIESRFWAKVNKNAAGGCWLWTASVSGRLGHGQFNLGRKRGQQRTVYAHRVSYELAFGSIPPGLNVCHRCDVPRCVRPDHLFLGTQQENLDDARQKGRLIDGLGARKLSDAAYAEILQQPYVKGSGVALAQKYGVSKVTISRIRHGRQGSTYRERVLERVPSVWVEIRGELILENPAASGELAAR